MFCCATSSSTVDDHISVDEERGQRIVPGYRRPESELDWEDITVFQWPNDDGSEGFHKPASTIGSQLAANIIHQRESQLATAAGNGNGVTGVRTSYVPSEVRPPENVSKKKKQGLFAKKGSKNRAAPKAPGEAERLPGDILRAPPAPPVPPGRDELPHITARRLRPDSAQPVQDESNGNLVTHQSVPLHGNLQLNFEIPAAGKDASPQDAQSLPPGTAVDKTEHERKRNNNRTSGSKRSKFSLKFKRPTFLSDSAFGSNKKRKSPKAYRAPDPPGFEAPAPEPPAPVQAPSSIDTGITEGRKPLDETMASGNRLRRIREPDQWEPSDIVEEELERDESPTAKLVGPYDPKHFVNKVALDATGNELPQWKKLLIAKQLAEKALKEDEEKARVEEEERRFRDMPGWKRAIIERKSVETRAKKEKEEQDLAAMEWASRNPTQRTSLDEDGLPITPWQSELRSRTGSRSSESDISNPT